MGEGGGWNRGRSSAAFDVAASTVMIAAGIAILWLLLGRPQALVPTRPEVPVPAKPLSIEGAPVLGNPLSRVALIAFADFECAFCSSFANETMPALRTMYIDRGLLQFVFRHLPLSRIHPNSERAATAAECAKKQGKFWDMHDELMANFRNLAKAALMAYAEAMRLDTEAFAACMAMDVSPQVKLDAQVAAELGVRSTPTFMVGVLEPDRTVRISGVIRGAQPISEFRAAIEPLLR